MRLAFGEELPRKPRSLYVKGYFPTKPLRSRKIPMRPLSDLKKRPLKEFAGRLKDEEFEKAALEIQRTGTEIPIFWSPSSGVISMPQISQTR